MIKTTNSIETPEWRSKLPRPVITVMHSMSSLEITEFVRVAIEAGHLKAVLGGLPGGYIAPMREEAPYEVLRVGEPFYSYPFKGILGGQSAEERAIENAKKRAQYREGTYRVVKTVYMIESELQEVRTLKLFGERKY